MWRVGLKSCDVTRREEKRREAKRSEEKRREAKRREETRREEKRRKETRRNESVGVSVSVRGGSVPDYGLLVLWLLVER